MWDLGTFEPTRGLSVHHRPDHNTCHPPTSVTNFCGGNFVLTPSIPVIFDRSLYDSLLAWQADGDRRQIADQPRPGTKIGAQAPICTLIACAGTASEVETALGFTPRL